eukprot:TRINITY_DN77274_c0_g1_i1.p1 TRINITY_DN77274_c0_g1~~TRINITY_DN77274_c0_g1_i1.p1  ORF type:complete len:285 (+),score=41.76 TRINITY_DN77274_c0_g1_i1:55-855(+)
MAPNTVLTLLLAFSGSDAPGALAQVNCSTESCSNDENLCGEFKQSCQAIGPASFGLQIWNSAVFQFRKDGTYRRQELAFLDKAACESGNAWIEVTHEGTWESLGGSTTVLGQSLAGRTVTTAFIRLIQEEPCITPTGGLPPSECYDGKEALKTVCPCNGWDWSRKGPDTGRNVGMFCSPEQECPLMHSVFLKQTQYFSFSADQREACFSRANTDKKFGWEQPQDDACYSKASGLDCPGGTGQMSSAAGPTLPVLMATSVALLVSAH